MANTLSDAIARLAPAKKPKGRLPEPAAREALPVSITEVLPSGADTANTGGGIASPLVEQGPSPTAVTYTMFSSDGLFSLEFESETLYLDDNGATVQITHKDPSA